VTSVGRVRSLRELTVRRSAVVTIIGVSVGLVLATLGLLRQRTLAEAARGRLEEQRIASEITRGVMRQLAAITAPGAARSDRWQAEYDAAGLTVYEGLRRYLFRPLGAEERLRLERVKEEHLRMEVSASRIFTPGRDVAADARASDEAIEHALSLVSQLDAFVQSREAELRTLVDTQSAALAQVAVGSVLILLTLVLGQFAAMRSLLRRHVLQPLDGLRQATERVGGGDLSQPMQPTQVAEFDAVGQSFNRMAEALQDARTTLEARNAELSDALVRVRSAQDELVESEKLGALGRMTAGLAHEINNPLASVLGYGELLSARLGELPPEQGEPLRAEFAEPIVREARRMRLLVRSLLQFARRADTELGPVPLPDVLQVVVELRGFAFANAGLTLDVAPTPAVAVRAERQHLQSVLLNLVNNALDAMRPLGRGRLRIAVDHLDETHVELCVDDDGPGLADPARVFEAFYTTKGVGEGTGLGLALVQRFMASFGGSITAENRPDGGARFRLRFVRDRWVPAGEGGIDTPSRAGPLPLRAGRADERVLVVEDEVHLQVLHRRLLARLGVTPVMASSVAAAREALAGGEFRAIISDVKMPGESGFALHDWVRTHHPALAGRFLFVTGQIGDEFDDAWLEAHGDVVLQKPFEAREYLTRVARILD
jgi:signal transduction histidine kinase